MAQAATERIEPAFDGLDTDTAPDYLTKTKAPVLENFLVDRPGRLPIRGPIRDSIDLYTGDLIGKPVGIWSHGNNLLVGLKANSATATRDPWVAPYRRAAAEADLGVPDDTLYHVNLETRATSTVTSVDLNLTPGPRFARLGAYAWGIGYAAEATDSATLNGGVQWLTQILRWDGTAAAPTAFANGPIAAQDIKAHLNRLFVLGGREPDTTDYKPNSLFWTDPGGPTADTVAMWQDDVSGLTNEIVVDSDDPADFGVGLARISSGLVIFKRRSIHMLLGQSPATFTLRTFTLEQGCIDPRSIVEVEDGVYFLSDQGFQFFDGAQLRSTSNDLRSSLLAEALATVGDSGVDGGQAIAGRLPNGYVGLSIGTSPATTETSDIAFSGLYHAPRNAWVGFSSDAMSAGRPLGFGRALSRSYLIDDQRLFAADATTAPELAAESERGFDNAAALFTFDSGSAFDGTDDALVNSVTGIEAWTSSLSSPIPARWHSRLAQLAQPTSLTAIKRLLLDYTFKVDGTLDDEENGWFVELVDGRGNVLLSSRRVPAQGDPSDHAYRRQYAVDVYGEANDAQLRIEWRGTESLPLVEASVLSAYLTHQPAQQRGSM